MSVLILLAIILHGLYHVWHAQANDMEQEYLGNTRRSWRLPVEYWLFAWASGRLTIARLAALAVGSAGAWVAMCYATTLGGPQAGLLAGCIILSSPTLVGALAKASAISPVALLWVSGLYALHLEHSAIAIVCGVALALLRHTSWPMALWLLWASGGIVIASVLAAYVWAAHKEVVLSQGWALLLQRKACPVIGYPRDGWWYAFTIAARRFEAWGAWALAALVLGHWSRPATMLALVTLITLVCTHLPRMIYRPKWVLGYLPDFMLPVAAILAVVLA